MVRDAIAAGIFNDLVSRYSVDHKMRNSKIAPSPLQSKSGFWTTNNNIVQTNVLAVWLLGVWKWCWSVHHPQGRHWVSQAIRCGKWQRSQTRKIFLQERNNRLVYYISISILSIQTSHRPPFQPSQPLHP